MRLDEYATLLNDDVTLLNDDVKLYDMLLYVTSIPAEVLKSKRCQYDPNHYKTLVALRIATTGITLREAKRLFGVDPGDMYRFVTFKSKDYCGPVVHGILRGIFYTNRHNTNKPTHKRTPHRLVPFLRMMQ